MKLYTGEVVSNKMDKTAIVKVTRMWAHPIYKKQVKRTKRYQVHDPKNELNTGDVVEFAEHKPISKNKRFIVLKVIK
jgi:small subunit ribosomal protein S17